MVKKLSIVPVAILLLTIVAGPAAAKGPIVLEATITGPGLKDPITLKDGSGGMNPSRAGKRLRLLADQTGVQGRILYGEDQGDVTVKPAGELGPRFVVTWTVGFLGIPGTDSAELTSDLYPYAGGGPLLYTPRDQLDLGEEGDLGGAFYVDAGWDRAPAVLLDNLQGWGLPALDEVAPAQPVRDIVRDTSRPAPASDPGLGLMLVVIAAGLGAAAIAGLALKRDTAL